MRKFNLFIPFVMTLLVIAIPACAEGIEPGVSAFFDWSYLATYSGAVAAVVFIVQFLKLPIDRIGYVPTRALVYGVSLAVLLLAQLFTALQAFNVEVVAFAAMGVYERTIALPEAEKNGELVEAARLMTAENIEIKTAQTEETEGEMRSTF